MPKVLISAGHEGRLSGNTGARSSIPNGLHEIELTPIVADQATTILRNYGVEVERVPADFKDTSADLALHLHFDGNATPCASGASIGYPKGVPPGSNKPAADIWREVYGAVWPYKWMPDNFTENLSGYYGYALVSTTIAELLLEFGEITCPQQAVWLQTNLELLGRLVAHAAGRIIDVNVPLTPPATASPATFSDVPPDHPFFADVEWLAAANITKGCKQDDPTTPANEGEFCPDQPVTRAQFAALLRRYHKQLGNLG